MHIQVNCEHESVGLGYTKQGKMEWSDEVTGDFLSLTHDPIQLEMINLAKSNSAGAVSSFLGTTRDSFEGNEVLSLEYEAYHEMAIEYMKKIIEKVGKSWSLMFKFEFCHC